LDSESLSVDDLLRMEVTEAGATYIRPSKYLCAEDGCVIKTLEGPAFFDKDHLTEEGSFLLLRPMLQQLELRQQRPDATGVK
jgi:hypothetical protein